MATKHPLEWPAVYPRNKVRTRSAFKVRSFTDSVAGIYRQLEMMGAEQIVVSTNIPIRNDGLPYASPPRISDPGVAVYFTLKKQPTSMACDKWDRVEDNAHAMSLTIEAMRGLDRWGASDMLSRVFQGFTALPAPKPIRNWWDVLEVTPASTLSQIELNYRRLIKDHHPDRGGSHDRMAELNRAIEEARSVKGIKNAAS